MPQYPGYNYSHRLVAPNVVEFFVPTPQGHRVAVVYLDSVDPRITAYNETNRKRSPATLYYREIEELILEAKHLTETINEGR